MDIIIKIIVLVSAVNTGDLGQVDAILHALSNEVQNIQEFRIDANKNLEEALNDYTEIIKQFYNDPYHMTLVVGEKGMELLKYLSEKDALTPEKNYICLGIHRYSDNICSLPIDHVILPEATLDTFTKREIIQTIPNSSLTFAVPCKRPSIKELKNTFDHWETSNKPSLNNPYIIVMLPGDAPDMQEKMRYFTKQSAYELFQDIFQLWEKKGRKHKILVQNSPRTGKYNPENGSIICNHEHQKGNNYQETVDEVSHYFTELLEKSKVEYSFFNFSFEIDGSIKKAISVYEPLLYLAQIPNQDNIYIVPGESVSMISQVTLYLPAEKIIVFMPDSMDASHEAILNLAIKRGNISYFSKSGDVVTPLISTQRTRDDAEQIAQDIRQGLTNKFYPRNNLNKERYY